MRDARYVLLDNRPLVQLVAHIMTRRTDEFDASLESAVVGPSARKRGQKRMMPVDDPVRIPAHKLRRKDLHVARQGDQSHFFPVEQPPLRLLRFGFSRRFHRNTVKLHAVELGQRPGVDW